MSDYMKAPCKHCPFRRDVTPYLHPDRAEELAYNAENRYGYFTCHKTTEHDDDGDSGEMLVTGASKECAGHLYLKAMYCGSTDYDNDGFSPNPDWNCYEDSYEMTEAYEMEWNERRGNTV